MRPKFQQGEITHKGANWVLRYHEDRKIDGTIKRVRTTAFLAPWDSYPLESNEKNRAELRNRFKDKIDRILAPINGGTPASAGSIAAATVGDFIQHSYFPRLEVRLQIPAGNELHIEPSTVDSYKDIFNNHVKNSPVAKIRLRDFTTRDGQRFLESLPQQLSHQTHLRIKNFLRGVFTWAIQDNQLSGGNPMEETKAGGRTKGGLSLAGLSEGEKLRKQKIKASNEHAYTLEEVAEMMDKLPEDVPPLTAQGVEHIRQIARVWLQAIGVALRSFANGHAFSGKIEHLALPGSPKQLGQ